MVEKYKIGLVMKSLQAEFFRKMQEGATQYAEAVPDLELISVGTASQTEVAEQIELVRFFITQKVDAIVLVPIDSKALVQPVIEAMNAGIPVVNIDIRLERRLLEESGLEVAFVGPDNFMAAYEVAKCLCSKLQPNDEVAILEGVRAADNAKQRKDGFLKAINETGLHLVVSESANWEMTQAAELFQDMWTKYPSLKGVFCSNDAMALGVLEIMNRNRKYLPLVGFDNDESIQPYLASKRMEATVDIFSSQMAVQGIKFALEVVKGKIKNRGVHLTPYSLQRGIE